VSSIAVRILLFLFGTSIGSFIGVLGSRYSEKDNFRLALKGRSKCLHCEKTLNWYELIPLVSFFVQAGKCRKCKEQISKESLVVEILSGLVFAFVPFQFNEPSVAIIWTLAFLVFILISIVDLRLKVIPDELTIIIAILGAALFYSYSLTGNFGLINGVVEGSFLGSHAINFWFGSPGILINYIAGILFGLVSFGLVYGLSKGRAMGFGDVKLAGAIGSLIGWPDIVLALMLSFITGAIWGIVLIARKKKNMKDAVPFGPFIILGVTLAFFFGYDILNGYFSIFGIY